MKRMMIAIVCVILATAAIAGNKGQMIYKKHCAVCHESGVAQAPKVHNQVDWKKRYDAAMAKIKKANPNLKPAELKAKTLDALIAIVKKGLGAMPAGGMCPKYSKQDYKDAIEFMMSKKK